MSDFSQNENELELAASPQEDTSAAEQAYKDEYEQFGTIFGEKKEDTATVKPKKALLKRQITTIIALVIALALLIGGTVAVINLIPEKSDEGDDTSSSLFTDFTLISHELTDTKSVTVTNSNGTTKFVSRVEKSAESGEDETFWAIDGVSTDFVDSSEIEVVIKAAISVTAKRTITEKTASECGFDEPKYTAYVEGEGFDPYTIYVGYDSPDQTGTYLMVSDDKTVYLVYDTALLSFDFEPIDFASTEKIPATSFKTSIAAYCDDEGTLETFDTLTITGKKFPEAISFVPNTDTTLSNYLGYVISSSNNRYADSGRVIPIFKYFSEGLSTAGAYSYDVTSQSLAKYGLNNPDAVVTISVAGEKHTFKFSMIDDTHCAVVNDASQYIRKVALSDAAFLEYSEKDFYSTYVYIRAITQVSNLTGVINGTSYSFDIKENTDIDSSDSCVITYDGKKIDASNFQDFYEEIISLSISDYETVATSEQPSMSIIFTDSTTGEKTTVAYTKVSATKYQFSIDGVPGGKIVSSEYNKIAKHFKMVANDEKIK